MSKHSAPPATILVIDAEGESWEFQGDNIEIEYDENMSVLTDGGYFVAQFNRPISVQNKGFWAHPSYIE